MPALVPVIAAEAAVAAPVIATTAPTLAAAGSTAALEATKQAVIQEGMKQAAQQATQKLAETGIQQATQTVGTEAAKQGLGQAAQYSTMSPEKLQGLDAAKFDAITGQTGMPANAFPAPEAAPIDIAGESARISQSFSQPLQSQAPTGAPPYSTGVPPQASAPPINPNYPQVGSPSTMPWNQEAVNQAMTKNTLFSENPTLPRGEFLSGQGSAVPDIVRNANPADLAQQNQLFQQSSRVAEKFAAEQAEAAKGPLEKGFDTALKYVKANPEYAGAGLMSLGQYMNQPEEEDKSKYKNKTDMSGFQRSEPSPQPFTPSYQYQGYAVGGPVENMSAMNAVGSNMMYPQAGLNTPLYSNPAVQRPEAVNIVASSNEPAVGAYTGEQKFAEGGISEETAKEYGLKTRKQRALKGLTSSYEEMQKEREKELAGLKTMGDKFDEGIIPRSRTQQLTSPYSAAIAEHTRLAKKNKVPVAEMPKTSLGDIDTYMDTPLEAASGGIMSGLGGYSDGGRLLKGPGDGVSDSIPAVIGKRQPARLADGEFVIPARIVSELGNGSTEAGARKLYAMMERVQSARKKSIGKKKVAVNSKADKHLPA